MNKKKRKLKYGEETEKVNYRIPKSFRKHLEKYISDNLKKYEINATEMYASKNTKKQKA